MAVSVCFSALGQFEPRVYFDHLTPPTVCYCALNHHLSVGSHCWPYLPPITFACRFVVSAPHMLPSAPRPTSWIRDPPNIHGGNEHNSAPNFLIRSYLGEFRCHSCHEGRNPPGQMVGCLETLTGASDSHGITSSGHLEPREIGTRIFSPPPNCQQTN